MEQLFDLSIKEYALLHKADKMRQKIRERTKELGIYPDHNEDGHFYVYEGKRYTSVTGRLQILKDPSLANWKMARAVDYIRANHQKLVSAPTMKEFDDILEQAKLAPQTEFMNAGSIGTAVHNWRERLFQGVIDGKDWDHLAGEHISDIPAVVSGARAVQKFIKECNYIPVACELSVADHGLATGGMVDDIGYVNGELALVDLKTSNIGDKESYFAQVALYLYMFRKLYGIRPAKLYILHASKTDGSYKLIDIPNIHSTIQWAKKVVEVSQGLDQIKQSKKKEYIAI